MIVTASDGTRYRTGGKATAPGKRGDARPCLWNGDIYPLCLSEGEVTMLEELPRIPDWPLPGPAPQYLSNDISVAVNPGDTVVTRANGEEFRVETWEGGFPLDLNGWFLGSDKDRITYLITRADPEVDA